MNGQLARQGMADCWGHFCKTYHATVNPDFGGFGMILSYLIQLSISLLSLTIVLIYCAVYIYRNRQRKSRGTRSIGRAFLSRSPDGIARSKISPHYRNFLRYLSDFHKLQCYYSITLQIATLIAQYGPSPTTHSIRNPFDEAFLLLLSINGILPVTITLYTLALSSKITSYEVFLTSVSAILASDTGITIVKLLSEPYNSADTTKGSYVDWPAAVGGRAPEAICGRSYKIVYPKKLTPEDPFIVAAVLCDALLLGMIVQWLVAAYPKTLPIRYLEKVFERPSTQNHSSRYSKTVNWMAHTSAALIFLYCITMEYFFFYQMLIPQQDRIVDFQDWGFGQIVGIAVWAVVIIDLARHEIALLWRVWRGSNEPESPLSSD